MRSATSAVSKISQPSIVKSLAALTRRPAEPPEKVRPRSVRWRASSMSQMFWSAAGRSKCGRAPSAARMRMGSAAVPAAEKLKRLVSV